MQVINSIAALRETLKPFVKEDKVIGLVPTMGALHAGHGALIKASVKDCDVTVVSVFLNPIQFGRNEDLDKYPKRLEEDAKLAESLGADFVFAPSVAEMYPDGDPLTLVPGRAYRGFQTVPDNGGQQGLFWREGLPAGVPN